MATLSFDGFVNIAVRQVTDKFPGAYLWEADGTPSKGQAMVAQDINQLRVVFGKGTSTIMMQSMQWGEFADPQVIQSPWLEDVIIKWPVPMDLSDAIALMRQGNYPQAFKTVTLRQPLYPGCNEPYFIFSMVTGGWVFVGVNSKSVSFHSR